LAETSVQLNTRAWLAKHDRSDMRLFTASKIHIEAFLALCCNGFHFISALACGYLMDLEHENSPFILFKEAQRILSLGNILQDLSFSAL